MKASKSLAALLLALLVGACGTVTLGPERLKPGQATLADALAREKPATEWVNEDGSRTLDYPGRDGSDQNVMMDFDVKGNLTAVRYVLNEVHFSQIKRAMTRAEVRRILGKPRHVTTDSFSGAELWEWPTVFATNDAAQLQFVVRFHPTADGVVDIRYENRFQ